MGGDDSQVQARILRVAGQVQGVGFRPFVYRLATELSVSGSVKNDPGGVTVFAVGSSDRLDELVRRLETSSPRLARVDGIQVVLETPAGDNVPPGFRIEASDHGPSERGRVTVDTSICEACLREIADPGDRRHRHALVNCTDCGPRYSIVRDLPYDRASTTMAGFAMCADCEVEYRDPGDRRFHAQPNCCPRCGPQVRLIDSAGRLFDGDPFEGAAELLEGGSTVAVKGIGGYHLAVDARRAGAVERLRHDKGRDEKPFAVMVGDLAAARDLADLSPAAEDVLRSPAAPIVLAPRRNDAGLAPAVFGGNHRIGLMLPYSGLHHLLLAAHPGPLVMTSANRSDDPLIADDGAARDELAKMVDAFLLHDRAIQRAVDDSILLDASFGPVPIRRARGFAPTPLALPIPSPLPGLAVGGELKNTVAVVRDGAAVLSQYIGDLSHVLAAERFARTIADLERLFEIRPEWIAFDAHPDYLSHRYARDRIAREGLDAIEVFHHHAHLAALMAEHGRTAPIIGLTLDGVGHGRDGSAWGGEVLAGDLVDFERYGRFRPLRLPGGDAAARETGRPALSWLLDALGPAGASHPRARVALPDRERWEAVVRMLGAELRCPPSSGAGRLFDAAAALAGLALRNGFEAQAGMAMESAAYSATSRPSGDGVIPIRDGSPFELDHRPLLVRYLDILDRSGAACAAWSFHDALGDAFARAAIRVAEETGIDTVGLTGGCFANELLTERTVARLEAGRLRVLLHRHVPPGDGGIAYGQAAIAAARGTLSHPIQSASR